MRGKVAFQRFFACYQSEASGKLLRHQMTCVSQLLLIWLCDKVLQDQFPSGDASDRDGSLDNWENYLQDYCQFRYQHAFKYSYFSNGAVNGYLNSSLKVRVKIQ